MICPNCHQTIDQGAAFCGNCGQPLYTAPVPPPPPNAPGVAPAAPVAPVPAPVAQPQPTMPQQPQVPATSYVAPPPAPGLPAPGMHAPMLAAPPQYAVATPGQHKGQVKALVSVLCGILGLLSAAFIPLAGLVFGIAGLITGTISRSNAKSGLSLAGIILSALAVTAGLGSWSYNISKHSTSSSSNSSRTTHSSDTSDTTLSSELSTPCYSINFIDQLNISNKAENCDMIAFNGNTLDDSSDAYKVYADKSNISDTASFNEIAKTALEKDVKTNLPGFTIDSQQVSSFAGSPAYTVTASRQDQKVAIVETAVFHEVKNGENIFLIVHAANDDKVDLSVLEAQWQWK